MRDCNLRQLTVRLARSTDLGDVLRLVASAQLPTVGVAEQFPQSYLVACDDNTIVSVAGLEIHDDVGLLRSVVVAPAHGSIGLGRRLVMELLRAAQTRGLVAAYLLTTTAPEYFARLGFARISREDAPDAIKRSSEFASVCPVSAICMMKTTG